MNAFISTGPAYSGAADSFDGTRSSRRASRVLVAANDGAQRVAIAAALTARGFGFVVVDEIADVPVHLKSGVFDLVISAMRDADGLELVRLVRQTMPGLAVIMIGDGELETLHLDCAAGLKRETIADNVAARLATLTVRERQVLSLIVAGRANKVIAYELSISPRTVENHRARVMEKLRVKSVAELVRIALSAEDLGIPAQTSSLSDTGNRTCIPATA